MFHGFLCHKILLVNQTNLECFDKFKADTICICGVLRWHHYMFYSDVKPAGLCRRHKLVEYRSDPLIRAANYPQQQPVPSKCHIFCLFLRTRNPVQRVPGTMLDMSKQQYVSVDSVPCNPQCASRCTFYTIFPLPLLVTLWRNILGMLRRGQDHSTNLCSVSDESFVSEFYIAQHFDTNSQSYYGCSEVNWYKQLKKWRI